MESAKIPPEFPYRFATIKRVAAPNKAGITGFQTQNVQRLFYKKSKPSGYGGTVKYPKAGWEPMLK
jgi:hypothetical protein